MPVDCRGPELPRGQAREPEPAVCSDFPRAIDRLRSENTVCQDSGGPEALARLRRELEASQARSAAVEATVGELRRELAGVQEQLLLQDAQAKVLVQDVRGDVDLLLEKFRLQGSPKHGGYAEIAEALDRTRAGFHSVEAASVQEVQELRTDLASLKSTLEALDTECRRCAAASACAEVDTQRLEAECRRATGLALAPRVEALEAGLPRAREPELRRLEAEVQWLRAEVQRHIEALRVELESFKLGPSSGEVAVECSFPEKASIAGWPSVGEHGTQPEAAELKDSSMNVAGALRPAVVEHSTLDTTAARDDLLKALRAVRALQERDLPMPRGGSLDFCPGLGLGLNGADLGLKE